MFTGKGFKFKCSVDKVQSRNATLVSYKSSPEQNTYKYNEYLAFVNMALEQKRLNRIFIDEAHPTCLGDHFREYMSFIKCLLPSNASCSIVMISATVPRLLKKEVLKAHGCSTSATNIIRGNRSRPHI